MKIKASHHQKDVVIAEIDAKTSRFKEKGEIVMATKKKTTKKVEEIEVTPVEEIKEETTPVVEEVKETKKKSEKTPKYPIGSIVYVSKEADADLNGFKLFPQYKKYTYTVEAYDAKSGVYSLRRLNLSLSLPEALIISPDERAHDMINRKQF
jgi:hypothetical protein